MYSKEARRICFRHIGGEFFVGIKKNTETI